MIEFFELDDKGMPRIKAIALTIYSFKELWRTIRKVDGDSDGRRKLQNTSEFAYLYFTNHYASKYRVMAHAERDEKLKKLLKIAANWEPDELYKAAEADFQEFQASPMLETVDRIKESIVALNKFMKKANTQIESLSITDSDDLKKYMDTIDRLPTSMENLKRAEAQLEREQDSMAKGRKGRQLNYFEMPK